ncbi:MAG: 4Fe-4S dicluster domain-containing protein [Nitrospiraceae bacterium]|nr:MAG: 4Fe-4S dicluster domain-containing protein [Nitrospiraceae bacterium]
MTEQTEKKLDDIKKEADRKNCPVQKSLYFIDEFLSGPMCGKCFPCSFGSYEARVRLRRLAGGTGSEEDVAAVKRIASNMSEASMCKKGKDTAKYILEHIDSKEFAEHVSGVCARNECMEYFKYVIVPDKCDMCGICLDVCKDNAITGEKKKSYLSGYRPFEIAQKRCSKCGKCVTVCPTGAIVVVNVKERETAGV